MSAVVGIYERTGRSLDGHPLDIALEEMVHSLRHRGPDGSGVWMADGVALGHAMLWTTPESLRERLPSVNRGGTLAITADARIDNRDDLIASLGVAEREHTGDAHPITDSDVILAAYERWGEACPEHLVGDFAFAIWDAAKETLFCARDHFGIKPFSYYISAELFAFGSEIKALLTLPPVPHTLNEGRVVEYLRDRYDDKIITFYQDIVRLPPAHTLTVSRDTVQTRRYWDFDTTREARLPSDEAYAAEFRRIFAEAVRCRLRSSFPVGSLLSGGLDSSAISCVARDLRAAGEDGAALLAVSAVYEDVGVCDERPYIESVLGQGGFDAHYVHGDRISPLDELERILWHQDEPFFAPGSFVSWRLYHTAREQGVRVLLNGHGGDETVSKGEGYLHELARAGRWAAFAWEAWGISRTHQLAFRALAWSYLRHYVAKPIVARSSLLTGLQRRLRGRRWAARAAKRQPSNMDLVAPALAERIDAEHGQGSPPHDVIAPCERERHRRVLASGFQPYAFEMLDKDTAAYGVEQRYPLWDKRLVEFCLALPARQKLRFGQDRFVFRRAMRHILPPQVRERCSKADFLPNLTQALRSERERLDVLFGRDGEPLFDYVNEQRLREVYGIFLSDAPCEPQDMYHIWKAACLGVWLRMRLAGSRHVDADGTLGLPLEAYAPTPELRDQLR